MAEPTRNRPTFEDPDEWTSTLLRYVEGPDGRMELREMPLTPEEFLDPQVGDTMVQGRQHNLAVIFLFELLARWFQDRTDVLVLSDLKHLMAPHRGPAPDVSVLMDLEEDFDRDIESYDVRTGIAPNLIIEVVSPSDRRIRKVDEVDKLDLYERLGVREYLLHDLPTERNGGRASWRGYRLGPSGRYARIKPDSQGRLFSETTGFLFGTHPDGSWAEVIDAKTGQRLLSPSEEKDGRLRAEEALRREAEKRQRETTARRAAEERAASAEAEVARLREELAGLRGKG
ncbi:MAG TPA: Uma2 family endonuclease [Thermoanaerobaculia bacterium]|jgi:Uma2 family endonuclease|nr:Uma2 family endonuclease [Thermoanaerobaculia bacterium]